VGPRVRNPSSAFIIKKSKGSKMKDNIHHEKLVNELKRQSLAENVNIWKRIALDLSAPSRNRRVINLYKINECAKDNETIIVPGKVLGTGDIERKVTIAAFSFSSQAAEKLKSKNCSMMSITELMQKNPKGKNVRILG
jgi:large subunit ribosomal protein L18e